MTEITGSQAGAQRRIRALHARGWSPAAIQRAAGLPAAEIYALLARGDAIKPATVQQVRRAYELLWNRQPPAATEAEREEISATLARASRGREWAPPMAWDDDQLDLREGRPGEGWKPFPGHLRRSADLAEDAEFVREHGGYRLASNGAVAMRLGVTRDQLEKALSRTRQADVDREAG